MTLMPLMGADEYNYRYRSEQAISYQLIETQLMTCRMTALSWDSIIDLLLNVNNDQTRRPSAAVEKEVNAEDQLNVGIMDNKSPAIINDLEDVDLNSCYISGASKFENSSISNNNFKSKIANKNEKYQSHRMEFPQTFQNTVANSLLNSGLNSIRDSKDGILQNINTPYDEKYPITTSELNNDASNFSIIS